MDALPEVLRVVISEALTSGKKLSWSVWDNGEITGVKLLWKPEVVDAPIRSQNPPCSGSPPQCSTFSSVVTVYKQGIYKRSGIVHQRLVVLSGEFFIFMHNAKYKNSGSTLI